MKKGRPKIKTEDKALSFVIKHREREVDVEPIDLLLNKQAITIQQHRAGMHLRWLYTLMFGVPTITANDPSDLGGRYGAKYKDDSWLMEMKQKYYGAISRLKNGRMKYLVMNLCIFSEIPWALLRPKSLGYSQGLVEISNGLNYLNEYFEQYALK